MLNTPVAFIVFNRPETTERVFARIAEQEPRHLLVIADGPRDDRPGEAERCAAVRAIATRVTWPCDLRTNFADVNMGCRDRVVSGLNWVFEQYDRAIIIEDDCLPDPSFFQFCELLLYRYSDDPRVAQINGNNLLPPGWTSPFSYYFSRLPYIWGWATWRREWCHYDPLIRRWPELKANGWVSRIWPHPKDAKVWADRFDDVYRRGHTWDFQWCFNVFLRGGLAATPTVNLVTNIGFGPDATHTTEIGPLANLPTGSISKLNHPLEVHAAVAEDDYVITHFVRDDPALPIGSLARFQRLLARYIGKIHLFKNSGEK